MVNQLLNITKIIMAQSLNDHLSIIVCGHAGSGKSTTLGHLVYKCGSISKRQISTFEKESLEMGKGSSKYAWVMDRTPEERERGMTLEVNYWRIKTEKYFCHLIDVPHGIVSCDLNAI